jgi:hypothetical protein
MKKYLELVGEDKSRKCEVAANPEVFILEEV